ncbi:putative 1-acyl-sn-glycerol-3-phosphate acyltransferase delta [Apostichopus japonicus]|uniref:Putative 1-acyl-sn-glycerol-3-phosphate acyltransferase delta n=1 Tax=Stichopus japonicus TaxID=307972 RepID=A0A2G8L368_STIJA|nr:putative 1-acyl-sn-glycerol-3-phosphate acyltransferase delta [Apostichopus japonicus]
MKSVRRLLSFSELVFLYDTYSGSHIYIHCDDKFFTAMNKQHGLLVMNHTFELDWLATWCVADRYGQLFSAKCFMKNELKYVPLVGWSFYLLEMPFLKRDFVKDREQLVEGVKLLADFPMPAKMLMFCEGTRFTPEKYEKSKAFAEKKGLPILKHHLTPRTKGFCMAVEGLKGRVPVIMDATVACQKNDSATVYDLLLGKRVTYHAFVKIRSMDEVPTDSEEETSNYCHQLYQEKDNAMDYFMKNDTFHGYDDTMKQHFIPPRIQPTLVAMFWYASLGTLIIYYLLKLLLTGSMLTILIAVLVAFYSTWFSSNDVRCSCLKRIDVWFQYSQPKDGQNGTVSSLPQVNGDSHHENSPSNGTDKKDE